MQEYFLIHWDFLPASLSDFLLAFFLLPLVSGRANLYVRALAPFRAPSCASTPPLAAPVLVADPPLELLTHPISWHLWQGQLGQSPEPTPWVHRLVRSASF